MRIHLYPADNGACGNLRMRWPGELARAAGYDVTVFDPGPMTSMPVIVGLDGGGRPQARLTGDIDFDVVVFQRPLAWRNVFAIQLLQQNGVRCVVELDDDLSAVHAQHDAFAYLNPATSPEANHQHLARCCMHADAVVVTTPALGRVYGQKRAVVVENHIPRRYLTVEADRDPDVVRIGWTGKVGSHAGDLNVLKGAITTVLRSEPSARLCVLGDSTGVDRVLSLAEPPEQVPGVDMDRYPEEVARFDIGIAPLADTTFNRSKSWLKPLDYASTGVPFVCSPTDEYKRFTAQGCGNIADRGRNWVTMLRRLIQSPAMRAEQAEAGREVAARWVMEDHIDRYVEAWAGVATIRDTAPMATTTTPER